jgi:hypothetical protein
MATTEAAAKYGYGYGDDSDQYGYGDGAPDGTNTAPDDDNDIYGYGDAAPDGTNTAPDSNDYGYGDAAPDEIRPKDNGGHGDYNSGYNDASGGGGARRVKRNPSANKDDTLNAASTHSVASAESYGEYGEDTEQPRRQRYRRRGSVTKYSVDGQEEVKKEHEQHQNVINQYRQSSTGDAMQPAPAFVDPAFRQHKAPAVIHESGDDAMSTSDHSSNDGTGEPHAHHKKKGKGKKLVKGLKSRMRRFSVGY